MQALDADIRAITHMICKVFFPSKILTAKTLSDRFLLHMQHNNLSFNTILLVFACKRDEYQVLLSKHHLSFTF